MKRSLILLLCLSTATAALGQGRIRLENDSAHLVAMTTDTTRLLPPDFTLAGQPVPAGGALPSGAQLAVDFYLGTSASSLSLVTTTTFSSTPGIFNPINLSVPGIPGNSTAYLDIQVFDSRYGSPPLSALDSYYGDSGVFAVTLNAGTAYPSILSSWPTPSQHGPFGENPNAAIIVGLVPEPTTAGLLALGAVLLGLRRRAG